MKNLRRSLSSRRDLIRDYGLPCEPALVISVDIGLINFAYVTAELDRASLRVKDVRRVDLRKMPHQKIKLEDCRLRHGNVAADMLLHLFQEEEAFSSADVILVERQPPGGLQDYEQVLRAVFNAKVILVSPVTVHAHFHMRGLTYDERKEKSIRLSEKCLGVFASFSDDARKHDMSDAYCILKMVYEKWLWVWEHSPTIDPTPKDIAFFDRFRFLALESDSCERIRTPLTATSTLLSCRSARLELSCNRCDAT